MFVPETVITCCHEGCGLSFAVPKWWESNRREDKTWWFCPNGHRQHFTNETEAEKLRRERDLLNQRIAQKNDEINYQRAQREAADRRASAARGQVTKIKNRVGHGVCPCCTRSFENLQRHMQSRHPDYSNASETVQ